MRLVACLRLGGYGVKHLGIVAGDIADLSTYELLWIIRQRERHLGGVMGQAEVGGEGEIGFFETEIIQHF